MAGFFVALFVLFISLSVFICSAEYKNLWGNFIAQAVKCLWAGFFLHIMFINMVKLPINGYWLVSGIISLSGGILISYFMLKLGGRRIFICALFLGLLPFHNSGNSANLLFFIFICLIVVNKSADIYLERRNFENCAPTKFQVTVLGISAIYKFVASEHFVYSGIFYGIAVYFCLHSVFLNAKRMSLWQGVWITTGFALGLCFY